MGLRVDMIWFDCVNELEVLLPSLHRMHHSMVVFDADSAKNSVIPISASLANGSTREIHEVTQQSVVGQG